ncbi:hypothetical protein [Flavitalea sp.]|nr:hypothetical protein [Flavitalea sp.]
MTDDIEREEEYARHSLADRFESARDRRKEEQPQARDDFAKLQIPRQRHMESMSNYYGKN